MIGKFLKRLTGELEDEVRIDNINDMIHVKSMSKSIMECLVEKNYKLAFDIAEELEGFASANIQSDEMLLFKKPVG